eukprot:CAMPEP_0181395234 /NCGR_PEP_ID=MMETSP1106-20121128/28227_1 /TAXON_ID=81844 /ORGANISM="Mantoniella antarctica, Strain SL-175" /LENGTH=379 /DNA_ID=CAMNT_0023516833 /DNA_START=357 /DNA_END=1492 /DNA_ORIENTATION=-
MDADDDNGEGGAEERKPLRTSMVMGDHDGGNAPIPASAAARGLAPEDGYGDVASQAHTQAVSPRRLADSKSPARDGAVDDDGSASPTRGRREISVGDLEAIKVAYARGMTAPVLPPKLKPGQTTHHGHRGHHGHGGHSPGGRLESGAGAGVQGGIFPVGFFPPGDERNSRASGTALAAPGSGAPLPHISAHQTSSKMLLGERRPSGSPPRLGFSDTIMNALAQKKLAEAKRTKKELMELRVTDRLGRNHSSRGRNLERAASRHDLFVGDDDDDDDDDVFVGDDDDDDDDDGIMSKTHRFGKRARATLGKAGDVFVYAAYRAAKPVIESEDFELLIIVIIFVNCISLALFRPTEPPNSPWNSTLDTLELSLNGIFTVELV